MADVLAGPNSEEALYPEHEKMKGIADESQAIGEFLETCGLTLCEWTDEPHRRAGYLPTTKTIEQLLAEHYEIDLAKVEQEKRAMLRQMGGD